MQTYHDRETDAGKCCPHFFSWSAVIAGGLIGLGLGFLLHLFGIGIGLTAYRVSTDGLTVLAIGGFIGLLIGAIVTMFVSGFAAGFLSGPHCGPHNYGVLYGFLAWCFGLLLIALFTSHISNFVANFNHSIGGSAKVYNTVSQIQDTALNASSRTQSSMETGTTEEEKNAKTLGVGSFIVFILFFIGALSACFGGYFGYDCWQKCKERS